MPAECAGSRWVERSNKRREIQKGKHTHTHKCARAHTHTHLMLISILCFQNLCMWISRDRLSVRGDFYPVHFCAWGNQDAGRYFADKSFDPDTFCKPTPWVTEELHRKFFIWTRTSCLSKHNEWVKQGGPKFPKGPVIYPWSGAGVWCANRRGMKTRLIS